MGNFWGCGGDFRDAESLLSIPKLTKSQREALWREAEREADRIVVHKNWHLALQVAQRLYRKSSLYLDEIREVLRQCGPRGLALIGEGEETWICQS